MRKYLIGLTALFSLVVVTPVNAQVSYYDGNMLMDWCKDTNTGESRQNVWEYNQCVIYLTGVADGYYTMFDWERKSGKFPSIRVCIPNLTHTKQLRQVFLNYASEYPRDWHLVAGSLALNAFQKAWPCKE